MATISSILSLTHSLSLSFLLHLFRILFFFIILSLSHYLFHSFPFRFYGLLFYTPSLYLRALTLTHINPILCSTAFFLTLILHSLTHSRFQLSHILVFSHTNHLFHTLTPSTLSHSFFLPTLFLSLFLLFQLSHTLSISYILSFTVYFSLY